MNLTQSELLILPKWINNIHSILPNKYHAVIAIALLIVMLLDFICSVELAKQSNKVLKTSTKAVDILIRNCMIILCIILAYIFDLLFETGSIAFVIISVAFMWQIIVSVMADIYVLGWQKYFPIWLIKLINNEITQKINRYIGKCEEHSN